jgi:hypothetical protein
MKAFKAWAIYYARDGEVLSLHMNRELAAYMSGGEEKLIPVLVTPIVKRAKRKAKK